MLAKACATGLVPLAVLAMLAMPSCAPDHTDKSSASSTAVSHQANVVALESEAHDKPSPHEAASKPFESSVAASSSEIPEVSAQELGDAIMGPRSATAEQMAAVFVAHGAPYPAEAYADAGASTIDEFCQLCVDEAEAEGVRPEVLFAQAMHETAWLQFGNQVSAWQCNFGGLGAVNSGGQGASFEDVRTGLRAQVQHLKAYATQDELANELVDPRFELVERGVAPTVHDLEGRWAWPGDGYGDAIMAIIDEVANAA